MMGMFWQRLITVVLGVPLAVWIMVQGSWVLVLAVSVIVGLGLYELSLILAKLGKRIPGPAALITGGLLIPTAAYIGGEALGFTAAVLVLAALTALSLRSGHQLVEQIGPLFFGWLYWAFLPSHLIMLRELDRGLSWLLLVVSCTWATDIGAYLVGSLWGRTKLAPAISPNKSVEGAVGGIAAAVVTAVVLGGFVELPLAQVWWIGIVVAVVGQVGDLTESALKREAKVKDSGRLLPGHGGILDRFDSMVFAAPVVFHLVNWLQG